jgi:hypothetical protein
MSFDAHANFAHSTVVTAPSPSTSGTTLTVEAGKGSIFPTPPFNATIFPFGQQPTTLNSEIVRVTGIATDTLTIVRTQEDSVNQSITVGNIIMAGVTSKTLEDIEAQVTTNTGNISTNTTDITNLKAGTAIADAAIIPRKIKSPYVASGTGNSGINANGGAAWTLLTGCAATLTLAVASNITFYLSMAVQDNGTVSHPIPVDFRIGSAGDAYTSTATHGIITFSGTAHPFTGLAFMLNVPAGTYSIGAEFASSSTDVQTTTNAGGCTFEVIAIESI